MNTTMGRSNSAESSLCRKGKVTFSLICCLFFIICYTSITEATSPCSSQPCWNDGTCTDLNNTNDFLCACPDGYGGTYCEIYVTGNSSCLSQPCQNGGTCNVSQTDGRGYFCHCTSRYYGDDCESDFCDCFYGTCVSDSYAEHGYRCDCYHGYTGSLCDEECGCGIHGQCALDNDGYMCDCEIGYTGQFCDQLINGCTSQPCLNGGNCTDLPTNNDYMCTCDRGYTGTYCENAASENPCLSAPCQNGGTCYLYSNDIGYYCACTSVYYGDTCGSDYCDCGSHGTCVSDSPEYEGFRCDCDDGYEGSLCTERPASDNPCLSDPCQNGGECLSYSDGVGSVCYCTSRYHGDTCEFDYCDCGSHGTCVSDFFEDQGFRCDCDVGYMGTSCGELLPRDNPCLSAPCQNGGTCHESDDSGYTCDCTSRYHGDTCGFDWCDCGSHGTCVSDSFNSLGYRCDCDAGYLGSACSEIIDGCSSQPCLNGGICTDLPTNNEYMCTCNRGYAGTNCEKSVFSPCSSQPCMNGGTCTDLIYIDDYLCTCDGNYYGTNCEDRYLNVAAVAGGIAGGMTLLIFIAVSISITMHRVRVNAASRGVSARRITRPVRESTSSRPYPSFLGQNNAGYSDVFVGPPPYSSLPPPPYSISISTIKATEEDVTLTTSLPA